MIRKGLKRNTKNTRIRIVVGSQSLCYLFLGILCIYGCKSNREVQNSITKAKTEIDKEYSGLLIGIQCEPMLLDSLEISESGSFLYLFSFQNYVDIDSIISNPYIWIDWYSSKVEDDIFYNASSMEMDSSKFWYTILDTQIPARRNTHIYRTPVKLSFVSTRVLNKTEAMKKLNNFTPSVYDLLINHRAYQEFGICKTLKESVR